MVKYVCPNHGEVEEAHFIEGEIETGYYCTKCARDLPENKHLLHHGRAYEGAGRKRKVKLQIVEEKNNE